MSPNQFWEYSLDEVDLFFEAKIKRKKEDLLNVQTLATLVTNGVAVLLNGSKKVPQKTIYDLHKELFEDDLKRIEETQKENELRIHKARMDAFMNQMNSRRKEV